MKMNYRLRIYYLILLFLSTGTMHANTASPSLNAKCPYNIKFPENASGTIYFDEGCTTAYILPPKTGKTEVHSISRTANLQFCGALKSAFSSSQIITNSIKQSSERISQMIEEFDPLDKELIQLRIDLALSKTDMEEKAEILAKADKAREEKMEAITMAKKDFENCTMSFSAESSHCIALSNELNEMKMEFREYSRKYNDIYNEARIAKHKYNRSSALMKELMNRYSESVTPLYDMLSRLDDLKTRMTNLYAEYGRLEGGKAQIIWSIGWDKLLEDFRRLNPTLRITWKSLPIKEAELIASNSMENTQADTFPSLISASIPGAKRSGIAGLGRGEKVSGTQTEPSWQDQASIVFGNSVGAHLVLNLFGSCPYFEGVDGGYNNDINELGNHLVANLVYSYEVAMRRGYTASYNLSSLLRKIEEKSKSGGLFSTSDAHHIVEDNDSDDWFDITFIANSSEFNYSPAEQADIKKEVRAELMDKTIRQMAILHAGSAVAPVLPEFSPTGVAYAAVSIRQCFHYYCQAGSIILGVVDSIWGDQKAAAEFHRNNSAWARESVNGIKFTNYSGSLTFTKR